MIKSTKLKKGFYLEKSDSFNNTSIKFNFTISRNYNVF